MIYTQIMRIHYKNRLSKLFLKSYLRGYNSQNNEDVTRPSPMRASAPAIWVAGGKSSLN